MAADRVSVLRRHGSLGLDSICLGIDKKSSRESKRINEKLSEYGMQLKEKQEAKLIYGISGKPLHDYYAKVPKMGGITGACSLRVSPSPRDVTPS